ncbi:MULTISPECIES: aspartate dehydrogenase [unclassified Bosea (in: a-proteobacteria)]|uniref:aspartate dehydrogenase n=1 Tax=unclassified Bosea (in: a-proteobacteria) TaxID=2653178 RepID=UPI000F760BF6|nr:MULTISPECIES: aspartate dehydrogenase [unclassified Bosea (in: a-proteobacteria)]AZO80345.1 aspartate dehydrogenase [Bosea sp. Tri-49]RXT23145.1 aspartate dehydrogenase [Bosea sp. Tri-39]RXT38616.1 aspartate dehydrogenase [Bosea sp. Tri-54]
MTPRSRKPLRIAIIGWGAISRRVAELLAGAQNARHVAIVAVGARSGTRARDIPVGAVLVTDPAQLAELDLDLVVEAAGRDAVSAWGEAALRSAPAFAIASASALTDTALLERLMATAEACGSQLILPPGALAGVDAIAAASALPLDEVVHSIVKPPAAWRGTPAEEMVALDTLTVPATFFSGSAREAAIRFPQNANVAVISALAGIGLDRTRIELVADPGIAANCHRLSVSGAFGRLDVTIENRPLAGNPKSSEMAALSLVRMIRNKVALLSR